VGLLSFFFAVSLNETYAMEWKDHLSTDSLIGLRSLFRQVVAETAAVRLTKTYGHAIPFPMEGMGGVGGTWCCVPIRS
jgi:hypothetical protein